MKYDVFICYRGTSQESVSIGGQLHTLLTYAKSIDCFFAPYSMKKGEDFKKKVSNIMNDIEIFILILSNDFFKNCSKADDIVLHEMKESFKNSNIKYVSIILPGFVYDNNTLSMLFTDIEIEKFKSINAFEYHTPYSFDYDKIVYTICRLKTNYIDSDKANRVLLKIINKALGESLDVQLKRKSFSVHKLNPYAQESRLITGDTFEIMTNTLTYDIDLSTMKMISKNIYNNVNYYYYLEKNSSTSKLLNKFINGLMYLMENEEHCINPTEYINANLHMYWLPQNTFPFSFTLVNRPKSYNIDHCSFYFIKREEEYHIYEVLLDQEPELVEQLKSVFDKFKNSLESIHIL